jgi:hypothetical protein
MFDLTRDFLALFVVGYLDSYPGKIGWAFFFYYFAYKYLSKIAKEDGIKNIPKFIFNRNFGEINRVIK